MTKAKLFRNGASQAVRLPMDCRFKGTEVGIKRIGAAVLLFPKTQAWEMMAGVLGKVDEDFLADRYQPAATESRKPLTKARKSRR